MVLCDECLYEIEDCSLIGELHSYRECDRCGSVYGATIVEDLIEEEDEVDHE